MPRTTPLSRRTLLRGAGGAALALPFLDAMTPARAQSGSKPPKRAVFFFSGCGFPMNSWSPGGQGEQFTLSPILSPLEPIKKDLLVIEGAGIWSVLHSGAYGASHAGSVSGLWTGTYAPAGGGLAISESVDQFLAKRVGKTTKFPSFHFGVLEERQVSNYRVMWYSAKATPVFANPDPVDVFAKLFKDFRPPAGGAPSMPPATSVGTQDVDPRLMRRKMVLDAVRESAQSLRCRLGSGDRMRLDEHLTRLSEVEKALVETATGGPASAGPGLGCKLPGAPQGKFNLTDSSTAPAVTKLQTDMLVMALACDLTRIAALQIHCAGTGKYTGFVPSFIGINMEHHDITHLRGSDPMPNMVKIGQWHARQFLYLVEQLKSVREGDGSSLLDNSFVFWGTENGDGWSHDKKRMGWTIAGSAQKYFKLGRSIKFPIQQSDNHNRLLLHLIHAMGQTDVTTFGTPEMCAGGPLPGLTA